MGSVKASPIWELWQHLPWSGAQLPPANTQPHSVRRLSVLAQLRAGRAPVIVITLGTVQNSPGRHPWGSLNKKYRCSSYFYPSCKTGEVRSTKAIAPGALGLVHLLLTWNMKKRIRGSQEGWACGQGSNLGINLIPYSMSSFLCYCQWDASTHVKWFKAINPLNGVFFKNPHVKTLEAPERHSSTVHPQSPAREKPYICVGKTTTPPSTYLSNPLVWCASLQVLLLNCQTLASFRPLHSTRG